MHAKVGDRIVVEGHHIGEPRRECEVLEVHGADGTPPYVVRWEADGNTAFFFPGTDASVVEFESHGV